MVRQRRASTPPTRRWRRSPGFPATPSSIPLDVNGDGKVDLVVESMLLLDGTTLIPGSTYSALSRRQDGSWEVKDTQLPIAETGGRVVFLDVNGRRLAGRGAVGPPGSPPLDLDQRRNRPSPWHRRATACRTSSPKRTRTPTSAMRCPSTTTATEGQDLLVPMPGGTLAGQSDVLPAWTILQATGSIDGPTFAYVDPRIPLEATLSDFGISLTDPRGPRIGDLNGDGGGGRRLDAGRRLQRLQNLAADQDLLVAVSDGMNAHDPADPGFTPNVSITYGHLTDGSITNGTPAGDPKLEGYTYLAHADPANGCAYPRTCAVGSHRVVTGYATNNGADGQRHFGMRYTRRALPPPGARLPRLRRAHHHRPRHPRRHRPTSTTTSRLKPSAPSPSSRSPGRSGMHGVGTPACPASPAQPDRAVLRRHHAHRRPDQRRRDLPHRRHQSTWSGERRGSIRAAPRPRSRRTYVRSRPAVRPCCSTRRRRSRRTTPLATPSPRTSPPSASTSPSTSSARSRTTRTDGSSASSRRRSSAARRRCSLQCRTLTRHTTAFGEIHDEASATDDGIKDTQLSITYDRDAFGNVVQTTADDAFGHHRVSSTTYDAEGHLPRQAREPCDAGLRSPSTILGSAGSPSSPTRTSSSPSARTTALGRLGLETRPDGTQTTVTLSRSKDGGPQQSAWRVTERSTTTGGADDTVEYDSLGRAVRWWWHGPDTGVVARILQEVAFDALGEHVTRRSVPASEGTPEAQLLHDTFEYDALGPRGAPHDAVEPRPCRPRTRRSS